MMREFSSGGVVYKKDKNQIYWLIRRTSASEMFPETYWMLPKGWLDDDGVDVPGPMASGKVKATEDVLKDTAIREVKEEGGVNAKVVNKIGTSTFFYTHPVRGKIMKFVTFFLMEWVEDSPDGFDFETSEIAWLSYKEALEKLSFDREKEVLKKAAKLLNS